MDRIIRVLEVLVLSEHFEEDCLLKEDREFFDRATQDWVKDLKSETAEWFDDIACKAIEKAMAKLKE